MSCTAVSWLQLCPDYSSILTTAVFWLPQFPQFSFVLTTALSPIQWCPHCSSVLTTYYSSLHLFLNMTLSWIQQHPDGICLLSRVLSASSTVYTKHCPALSCFCTDLYDCNTSVNTAAFNYGRAPGAYWYLGGFVVSCCSNKAPGYTSLFWDNTGQLTKNRLQIQTSSCKQRLHYHQPTPGLHHPTPPVTQAGTQAKWIHALALNPLCPL